ncbi:hypothetical protein MVEN_01464300 [Mycena venus]|uniref:Uncharacterized protein n=1 Tax=Mycena venus TaxID=2733690 RepID=A0A8H6XTV7_9AGAR|nr:hypothetical protein MVEN_01464300 [Mycena venus]
MTQCRSSTAQKSPTTHLSPADEVLQHSDGSERRDWLAEMIFGARAMATGAEFVPLPGVRAAFGAVIIFLETVDKIKRNREDLRDLCASTFEIVLILEEEVKIHGHGAAVRFAGLLEKFISFLRFLQGSLEKLIKRRSGLRGRFQEILSATKMTEDIARHRMYLNELRSNFLLVTVINTNFNVAGIQNSVAGLQSIPRNPDFRNVALGDINLLYETAMGSKLHKIKIFVARISGEPSAMTVVRYEDEQEKWQHDLDFYTHLRHPHVWQLFGISTAPTLRALIFHDELIPLPIYRQFHRPDSDFVWACVEAMLFQQFKDCSQYHRWSTFDNPDGLEATICVKREPIGICLTIPGLELEWEVDKIERIASYWHSPSLNHRAEQDSLKKISTIITSESAESPARKLSANLNWEHFFTVLTPIRMMWTGPWRSEEQFFLGSVIRRPPHSSSGSPLPSSLAYIPNECEVRFKEWTLRLPPRSPIEHLCKPGNDSHWQQFTFPRGTFKSAEAWENLFPLSTYIQFANAATDMLNVSWLAQANACFGPTISDGKHKQLYGVIDTLGYAIWHDPAFQHILHPEGIAQEVSLFVAPLVIKFEGSRVRVDPPQADGLYWSLDPMGNTRLSLEQSDLLRIPRVRHCFFQAANYWREYHYGAIRDFAQAKGFDPYAFDLTHSLRFPLAEMESSDPFAVQSVEHTTQ